MRLYNTLTRQIDDFEPQAEVVKLYSCGPTVYDYAHLGNLRAYVFTDTLRRVLETNAYKVRQVMNITDVGHLESDEDESGGDKLEKGAQREGKTVWEVAEFYTAAFKRDVEKLNIQPPSGYRDEKHGDSYARATEFIPQQIEIVNILLGKGFAYITEQAIYFEVAKLPSYGELTGQKLEDKEVAARAEVVIDQNKRHPQDFALWFFTIGRFSEHSMRWSSPWGEGFPGWHLECSAIIHTTLGEPLDIHTGGVDHIGTHHTNEMAQTEAAFGKKLSLIWAHNEHMLVDGRKMSKSLSNFFTLEDVIKRGYEPLALRLLYLQSHYRSQANFTWESLDGAVSSLKNFYAWADLQFQEFKSEKLQLNYKESIVKFKNALADDINTPQALAILNGMVTKAEELGFDSSAIDQVIPVLEDTLGIGLTRRRDITPDLKQLISERETARTNQDWTKADELRKKLSEQGIEINDTPHGSIWARTAELT